MDQALLDAYRGLLAENLSRLRERISAAAHRAGRDPAAIELLAVSKLHPPEAVAAAYALGLRGFGENRVQEAQAKFVPLLPSMPGLRLSMIGHLQGNKVGKALGLFHRLDSIDSLELLESIAARVSAAGGGGPGRLEILLELRTAEDSKSGFADEDGVKRACAMLAERASDSIIPRGLMTMAPLSEDERAVRASFSRLRRLFEAIKAEWGFPSLNVLSMGMSGDFEQAIEEGSTQVRIGTALFGERTTS